jgi:hypothetical protein
VARKRLLADQDKDADFLMVNSQADVWGGERELLVRSGSIWMHDQELPLAGVGQGNQGVIHEKPLTAYSATLPPRILKSPLWQTPFPLPGRQLTS